MELTARLGSMLPYRQAPKVPDSIEPICDESGEMNSGQEIPGQLVVSGGDAAEVFSLQKQRSMTFGLCRRVC